MKDYIELLNAMKQSVPLTVATIFVCSGMLVQDPSKQNDVDSIFDRARQMGAMQGPLESILPSSSSRSFTGTGRTLAGETVPAPAPQPPESIVHNIIFWRNGFTVNGGPLRRLDDPENASFLEVSENENKDTKKAKGCLTLWLDPSKSNA